MPVMPALEVQRWMVTEINCPGILAPLVSFTFNEKPYFKKGQNITEKNIGCQPLPPLSVYTCKWRHNHMHEILIHK